MKINILVKEYFMNRDKISILSLLLACAMLASMLVACDGPEIDTQTTDSESVAESVSEISTKEAIESDSELSTESETEVEVATDVESQTETDPTIKAPALEGNYAEFIEKSNDLANEVVVYYPSGTRNNIVLENRNMSLNYLTATFGDKMVQSIKNTKDRSYVENTMDVFVKMKDNDKLYFSSASEKPALMNIYRYGYYYYQVLIDGPDFTSEIVSENEKTLKIKPDRIFNMSETKASDDGNVALTVTSTYDPRIQYDVANFEPFAASDYNYIAITMKITAKSMPSVVGAGVYVIAGSKTTFSSSQYAGFKPVTDGEYHTYYIRIDNVSDYTDNVKGLRFDLDGSVGDVFEIKEIKAIKANTAGAPELGLNRIFNVFSDKLVQTLQVTATSDTDNIEKIGMITNIAADTVEKLIVKDHSGTHTTLDGVDWNTAEYIGFDIKNVGVFGYILLPDETSGKLEVTLSDGKYVITQSRAPQNGTLLVPTNETLNTGDFYMGQRIYTDESHDFDAFLLEAYCERNPLPTENITVDVENSTQGAYLGYNVLRGTYEFTVEASGFNTAYFDEQNKHFSVRFTIKSDGHDRTIYMESSNDGGQLEWAAVLDENNLLLPVPVEVCKNFNDGDRSIHWVKDTPYNSTYLPIALEAEDELTLNFLHLYQNWGRFPLKQISSIQFHCPYYHLSTGVTETNCIVPWYTTKGVRSIYSVLPDHRAMSAPLWLNQPQHTSGGEHGFLEYTDASGNYSATENTANTITSYGPTYAEIVMDYISDDGKIKASYTHMEMPQTDENRTYYTMEYEVLEDISFTNFREDFIFYTLSPKSSVTYQNIGYLSEKNQPATRPANTKNKARTYLLGDNCPYFSMYQDDDCTASDGYVNVAFLIYSSEFTIGGEKVSPSFIISDLDNTITLSLDLGEVTLKAGDRFTINAIILPWGSQLSDYSLADKNVRDVRENSLLNPLKAQADADCTVKESVFLPTLRSTNGKSAEFTLRGGANNCAVKIEGFTSITVPTVYEKIDGEWVRYNLSSKYYPDGTGHANTYDGYGIQYEEDGFLSYSFVAEMRADGDARSFKIVVDEEEYVDEVKPAETEEVETEIDPIGIIEGYNRYFDAKGIEEKAISGRGLGKKVISEDGSYISIYGDGANNDPQFYIHSMINEVDPLPTGRYFVFKYRMPSTNAEGDNFAIFTSTESPSAKGESVINYSNFPKDDQWHVVAIDCAAVLPKTFLPAADGGYYAQHVRFDVFNRVTSVNDRVDFEYIGFEDDFYAFLEANKDVETITFYNGVLHTIPTEGGNLPVNFEDDTSANTTSLNVYLSAKKLAFQATKLGSAIGYVSLSDDESYTSIYSKAGSRDSYFKAYAADTNAPAVTGQYLVFKYKATGTEKNYFEVYASTVNSSQTAGDNFYLTIDKGLYSTADQWNIMIVDMSALRTETMVANDDGNYSVKYLRFDIFNTLYETDDFVIDLAYMGICDDLKTAVTFDTSVETAIFWDGINKTVYSTASGEIIN